MIEAILALLVSFSLFNAAAPIYPPVPETKPEGIVRLHDLEFNFFYCSGVVVSDTLMVTAAHCVNNKIVVAKSADQQVHGYGVLFKIDNVGDVAVYKGDFSMFKPLQMETDVEKMIESFKYSKIEICGYPKAGPLFCNDVSYIGPFNFFMQMTGLIWPGMSGGPVIDKRSGKVVGVNSAAYGNTLLLAPLVNILAD